MNDDKRAHSHWAVSTCIGCGCNDHHACWDDNTEQPCHWIRLNREQGLGVCSACPDYAARWDAGDRSIHVPVEPPSQTERAQ